MAADAHTQKEERTETEGKSRNEGRHESLLALMLQVGGRVCVRGCLVAQHVDSNRRDHVKQQHARKLKMQAAAFNGGKRRKMEKKERKEKKKRKRSGGTRKKAERKTAPSRSPTAPTLLLIVLVSAGWRRFHSQQ